MTAEGQRPKIERGIKQEELIITPDSLHEDNHSPQAQLNREQWEEKRIKGELIAYLRCSDARLKPVGIGAVSWGSIAGADNPDRKFAADNRRIGVSIVLTHFDGDTVKLGEVPTGCGGLKAKEEIGNTTHKNGIGKYISEVVGHPDMLIQAWVSAENMAAVSGKPALAAAQDHLTLQIYPIALFTPQGDGEMLIRSKVRVKDTLATSYDPKRIYENGIPTISESSLPDVFRKIMQENMQDMQETHSKYPDLGKMQKVQHPRMILFSTDIRSARVRYPKLSSVPGSIFKVIIPREKVEGTLHISDGSLERCFGQLEYPILHSVANHNDPNESFFNTDRLIIETGSIDLSRQLAQRAMEQEWIGKWLKLSDKKIIVVQTIAGVSNVIEWFTPQTT